MDSTQFLEAASHNWEDTACVPVNRTAFFMNVCGAWVDACMQATMESSRQSIYPVIAPGVMSPQCGAVLHVLHGSGLSPLLPLCVVCTFVLAIQHATTPSSITLCSAVGTTDPWSDSKQPCQRATMVFVDEPPQPLRLEAPELYIATQDESMHCCHYGRSI